MLRRSIGAGTYGSKSTSRHSGLWAISLAALVTALAFSVGLSGAHSSGAARVAAPAGASPSIAPSANPPSAVRPATGSANPLSKISTIAVGSEPEFATYNPSNGYVYVPNWGAATVSVLQGTSTVATVPVGAIPFSTTYDPLDQEVYVVNSGSNNVSVISGTHVVANIPVGSAPEYATYDAFNEKVYVANTGSASITVINGTVVNATVPVGSNPSHPVFTSSAGGGGGGGWRPASALPSASSTFIFVPNTGSNTVSVIGGAFGTTVTATIPVGTHPQFAAWDPNNVWLYVPNEGSNNLSVLTTTSVLYTVPTGSQPYSATLDAANQEVYVPNFGSGTVTDIGGPLVNTVLHTIPVGTNPEFISEAPSPNFALVVPNTGSANISVLDGTIDVGSLLAGTGPIFATSDPATKMIYVQNFGSSNVTMIGPSVTLTFKAHGLPPGSTWSVHVDAPPTTGTNTTVGLTGTLVMSVVGPGTVNYSISAPAGFGVARVTGPGFPSQSSAVVPGAETLIVLFAPIENVTFAEVGLPNGTSWWVNLTTALPHGGPGGANASSTTATIVVSLVADPYHFRVSPETDLRAAPSHGTIGIPHHAITKTIHYILIAGVITFVEKHLPASTTWQVNITSGPAFFSYPFHVSGITAALHMKLVNGTYTYQVAPVTGFTAIPTSGTFTVVAPHPHVFNISWTPVPAALPVATPAGLLGSVMHGLSAEPTLKFSAQVAVTGRT